MGRKKLFRSAEEKKELLRIYRREYHKMYQKKRREAGYFKSEEYKLKKQKEYRKKHPIQVYKIRPKKFRNFDGLTKARFDAILGEQNNGCACCGSIFANMKNIHVDHNHETGAIRGLLCRACNVSLGQVGDNFYRLTKLVDYIYERG